MTKPVDNPSADPITPPSAPPPREVTSHVRRRAWFEPRVKFWWLIALALSAMFVYFFISRLLVWQDEKRLIEEGTLVEARIVKAGIETLPGRRVAEGSKVTLEFEMNGENRTLKDVQLRRPGLIITDTLIPLRVDPSNPARWTDIVETKPLALSLAGALTIVPALLFCGLMALIMRGNVLRVWRYGSLKTGLVVDVKQSALSPLSRQVRYTRQDGDDKRIFHVTMPARIAPTSAGQIIQVIAIYDQPAKALSADVYVE